MPGKQENDEVVEDGKIAITVPSEDPEERSDDPRDPKPGAFDGRGTGPDSPKKSKKGKGGDDDDEDQLSEEDQELKDALELAVSRVAELGDEGVTLMALNTMCDRIKTSTSSMTAVPKPLKFLSPLFDTLRTTYERLTEKTSTIAKLLADILSVLSMVIPSQPTASSLNYKLKGNRGDLDTWGHEYIRHLAGEIGTEHQRRTEAVEPEDTSELMRLVDQIVPFNISHSAEAEAVDLLMEVQELPKLLTTEVDADSTKRICQYLLRAALYIEDPEYQSTVFDVAYKLYEKQERWCDVLRVALLSNQVPLVKQAFESVSDPLIRKQMAFILSQHRYFYYQVDEDCEDGEELNEIIGNSMLSQNYHHLATDLDVTEAKDPKDVYKSHLADTGLKKTDGAVVNSALQNQAATYVNGFVNMGFGKDNLVTKVEANGSCEWIYQNKPPGILSATASLGMVHQWDVDAGMAALDRWSNVPDNVNVMAGAALGIGICNAGCFSEVNDVAFGTLADFLTPDPHTIKLATDRRLLRINAITGLGLAYAATSKEDVVEVLADIVGDEDEHIDVVAAASLSLGLICVGTGNDCDAFGCMLTRLMAASDLEKGSQSAKYIMLGVGLVFLGCGEAVDVSKAILETLDHPVKKYGLFTLDTCAYCGTGNVLKVQELLHQCSEHLDGDEADFQMVAVLGISLITLGEVVGMEMSHRTMQHMLQYGELPIRRTVPLALALLHLSDPDYTAVDTLSRLSHDPDKIVAANAILAMGFVGCGTNNSRIAGLLKALSVFHKKEADILYTVRIAQGLLHMGKGLVTVNPYHSDRLLMNRTAIGSILIIMHGALKIDQTLLGSLHYHLYYVASAVVPRMIITVDEDLEPVATTVRVGEAVDTVGQAGQPRTITGFQTHNTPVLLHHHERAVFASDDYEPIASVLEGTVVCKKVSAEQRREKKLKEKREARAAAKAAREAREKLAKEAEKKKAKKVCLRT